MKKDIKYYAYLPLSKKARYNDAIDLIEKFLTDYRGSYNFKVVEKTTNNFKKFKDQVTEKGYIEVSNEGCKKTIYTKEYFNIIARFWHDNLHLKYDLDFTIEDEKIVAYKQIEDLSTYGDLRGSNTCTIEDAKEIIYHDIIGQVNYYDQNQNFVDDQKTFVYSRFLSKGSN